MTKMWLKIEEKYLIRSFSHVLTGLFVFVCVFCCCGGGGWKLLIYLLQLKMAITPKDNVGQDVERRKKTNIHCDWNANYYNQLMKNRHILY